MRAYKKDPRRIKQGTYYIRLANIIKSFLPAKAQIRKASRFELKAYSGENSLDWASLVTGLFSSDLSVLYPHFS